MDAKVCDLINGEDGTQKSKVVRRSFMDHEDDAILGVCLCPVYDRGQVDIGCYKWMHYSTNRGKSSYKVNTKKLWKRVWKAEISLYLGKLWILCVIHARTLPTKLNHLQHHLSTDGVCEGCGKAQESTGHVFCCCKMAREIWTSCNLGHIMISDEEDFTNVSWRVVQDDKIEAHVIELIMMTNWTIWTHRN